MTLSREMSLRTGRALPDPSLFMTRWSRCTPMHLSETEAMRVLVVEDQADLRRLIGEMLEEEGYAVDLSDDGVDGLGKAQSWPYDAIVLDIMLPKLDGWDFLEQLRETRSTPVLVLSARDTLPDRVLGLDLGADDYLVKPFERQELLARLRALIRRAAGQSSACMTVCGITIDPRAKTVAREGQEIPLTAKEFSLLEYLAMHAGRVISRTELYDHLFDETSDTASNLLDVYVSNLRRKLGADVIETRRGIGYVIPTNSETGSDHAS